MNSQEFVAVTAGAACCSIPVWAAGIWGANLPILLAVPLNILSIWIGLKLAKLFRLKEFQLISVRFFFAVSSFFSMLSFQVITTISDNLEDEKDIFVALSFVPLVVVIAAVKWNEIREKGD